MGAKSNETLFELFSGPDGSGNSLFSFAEELTEIDPDMANTYGTYLVKNFKEKITDAQVKLEEDVENAVGLHNGSEGMILIPTTLPEDPEGNEEVKSEKGAGLAYLFLSEKFTPVIDGKPVDKENSGIWRSQQIQAKPKKHSP